MGIIVGFYGFATALRKIYHLDQNFLGLYDREIISGNEALCLTIPSFAPIIGTEVFSFDFPLGARAVY